VNIAALRNGEAGAQYSKMFPGAGNRFVAPTFSAVTLFVERARVGNSRSATRMCQSWPKSLGGSTAIRCPSIWQPRAWLSSASARYVAAAQATISKSSSGREAANASVRAVLPS
jgi:hypothetical protein